MRSSDFLFRLIKALNKGDRRNFKLFARLQDGDKKYIQLFDAIDKQEDYDERKLLKQFKGERFTKQFSVAKNYLYNYILRTLDIFNNDPHAELSSLIHKIEILMGKHLYDQAEKLVRKAKHMAEKQERFGEMLELLNHQRLILFKMEKTKLFSATMEDIHQQQRQVLRQLDNFVQYVHLFDKTYGLMKSAGAARMEAETEQMDEILAHPLLQSPEKALSVRAKLMRLDVLNDGSFFKHDFQVCLQCSQEMIDLYDSNPEIKREKNMRYIEILSNYGLFLYQIGNTEESKLAMEKLRATDNFNEEEKIRILELYYSLKIGLCIETLDVEEGKAVIEDFESLESRFVGKMMKRVELQIYYLSAYFYLYAGDYSKALTWVNKFLNEPKTEVRTDLQCMARILNLMIHLELGNRDLLEYELKSVYRFISNRDRLFNFERTVLKYLRQLTVLHPDEDDLVVLENFQADLLDVLDDPFEQKAATLLDVLAWIDAKAHRATPAERAAMLPGR